MSLANTLKLHYAQPAADWNEALPLGNGKIGAMVFGGISTERIQINEETVWAGEPNHRLKPNAYDLMQKTRTAIIDGELEKAEQLALQAYEGNQQGSYQTLGDIMIDIAHPDLPVTNYHRELDLATAVASSRYRIGGDYYFRETLVSAVDQVMVMKLSTTRGSINLELGITRPEYDCIDTTVLPNTLVMHGHCGGKGSVQYHAAVKVIADRIPKKESYVKTENGKICVRNAANVYVIFTAATNFNNDEPLKQCIERLIAAEAKAYDQIKAEHIADYQKYFQRVNFELEHNAALDALPTDERLMQVSDGAEDLGLVELLYQYGRYLLISSSRPESELPANLQGIWNEHMQAPWRGRYTININTEMNYWPAEVTNLSECHEPLMKLVERLKVSGRKMAHELYRCRGFMAHHNTNIWADASGQDSYLSSTFWPLGAAWLALHFWDRYEFTLDAGFLAQAYPTLKEAALFFIDYLIEDDKGRLVTCPSLSPENKYRLPNGHSTALCAGPTMDNQILHQLFAACIKAADTLNIDDEFTKELIDTRNKLPETKIGSNGTIMEWLEDYVEQAPGHRHISHLWGLYPADQITVENTPELAEAAQKTLTRRLSHGGGHTGWSCAWIINMYARLHDADNAYKYIQTLLAKSTYPNLFDAHPPFQIDGNFGATSGITEMLLQSHCELIRLLPALPQEWSSGSITGLKARGNLEIDLTWQDGKLVQAVIRPLATNNNKKNISVKYIDIAKYVVYCDGKNIATKTVTDDIISFNVTNKKEYIIKSQA